MKSNYLVALIASVWVATHPFLTDAKEVITQNFAYVQNVVSQNLISAGSGNIEGLQLAKDALPAIVSSDTVKIYRNITDEESFVLKLEILRVADGLMDKSFDPKQVMRAGIFGNIPWPPDAERPETLRGEPLWWQRTPPEYYKERNPDLYAFYKPLYEENQRNTKKHRQESCIRSIRYDLLRELKARLKYQYERAENTLQLNVYLDIIDKTIKDKQLREEILCDTPIKHRLPEKPPAEKIE